MLLPALLLALAPEAAPSSPDRPPRNACRALEVASATSVTSANAKVPRFSPLTDPDLEIRADLGTASASTVLYFKLYTPGGYLYQTFSTTVGAGGRASVTLPVAGTTIMNNGLYGRWRVEAWLADRTAPCSPPRAFVISE